MGLTANVKNVGHNVYETVGIVATNISNGIGTLVHGVTSAVSSTVGKTKNYVVQSLTISEKNKEKISNGARKIAQFILKNKSLIFFGLTVGLSYYMAPVAAFEYLAKFGLSLTSTFVSGMLIGASSLAIKNIFVSYPARKPLETNGKMTQDDKINYLLGISNLCLNYLYPTTAFMYSIASSGFMLIKSGYRFLTPPDEVEKDHKVTFLVPRELEDGRISSTNHAQTQTVTTGETAAPQRG